jgi:two-component system sensor histidine kinase YesM
MKVVCILVLFPRGVAMLFKSGRKFLSIRTKIIILLVTSITVPFILSGILTYHKYTKDSEQSISNYANQIVSQISLNLDRYIKELERVTHAPHYDAAVMSILTEHSDPARKIEHLQLDEQLKMIFFMSSLEFERSEIRGIVLFTNDGIVFSNSEVSTKNLWSRQHNGWMDAVDKEAGGLTIIPPHEVQYYNAGETTVVSLARQIREPYTHRKLGIIKVDYRNLTWG